jgi:hypothetical protein
MNTRPRNPTPHTSEAPLANNDVPDQDGSEDPGSGLEQVHDAMESPSSAEHVNQKRRGGISVPRAGSDNHNKSSR